MDIQTVLISLTASICTVVVGKWCDAWWSKRGDDRKLHFLAIKLMFLFEGYGEACLDELIKTDSINSYADQEKTHSGQIPTFPELPIVDDHRLFDHELLIQILDFPIKKLASVNSMTPLFEFCYDDDEIAEAVEQQIMKLGIDSFALAEKIRNTYKLPMTRQSQSLGILIKRQDEFMEMQIEKRLDAY